MRTSNYFLLEKVSWIFIWNWNLVWSQGNCGRHEFFNYGYHSRKPFSIKHAQELCAEKNATLSNFNTPEDIEKFYKRNKYLLERTCTEVKDNAKCGDFDDDKCHYPSTFNGITVYNECLRGEGKYKSFCFGKDGQRMVCRDCEKNSYVYNQIAIGLKNENGTIQWSDGNEFKWEPRLFTNGLPKNGQCATLSLPCKAAHTNDFAFQSTHCTNTIHRYYLIGYACYYSCRVATSGLIDSNDTYSDVMVTGTSLVSSSESFDKDSSEDWEEIIPGIIAGLLVMVFLVVKFLTNRKYIKSAQVGAIDLKKDNFQKVNNVEFFSESFY